MNRIERKFKELEKQKKKAFIAFITAGYPDLNTTEKLVLEFSKIGVDIVELGVPFSDPMADGPVIQEASQASLENGTNISRILDSVKRIRKYTQLPICLMTYYNPVFCFGEEKFARLAHNAGVDGVIIPDLPPEEGRGFIKTANKYKLNVICFISPTTSAERIKYVSGISRGFIYYVSLTGVTGERRELPADIARQLKLIKNDAKKPVCVGFGVSSPQQVKQIYKIADGVIVGSAIVRCIKNNIHAKDLDKITGRFISRLKNV